MTKTAGEPGSDVAADAGLLGQGTTMGDLRGEVLADSAYGIGDMLAALAAGHVPVIKPNAVPSSTPPARCGSPARPPKQDGPRTKWPMVARTIAWLSLRVAGRNMRRLLNFGLLRLAAFAEPGVGRRSHQKVLDNLIAMPADRGSLQSLVGARHL